MQKRSTGTASNERKTIVASAASAAPVVTRKAVAQPSAEDIARRAYEIYVARGQTAGRDQEDWLQAERELTGATTRNN
ncbi:DUF2934 domain-containing protein [Pedosphaera parvula]|uniref:DUF2934 domain-containing protein n=1 Tax=Pedosphaera parvula (strain Ellin514) TaxID=320771 RepID=B9XE69_PEDPL|nr:DUF2934 domain-containing protein [Pedosphaera parvula]EEF61960.1 conserved hypothetical protein [Pedosphaera parvula Ellin514]